jgi:hypothetical protein
MHPRSGCPYTSSAMDKILSLIEHYGYLFVFFGVMLGCSGIPFPGATILLEQFVKRLHLSPS